MPFTWLPKLEWSACLSRCFGTSLPCEVIVVLNAMLYINFYGAIVFMNVITTLHYVGKTGKRTRKHEASGLCKWDILCNGD